MAATEYDFIDDQAIEQGTTWARQFIWKDSEGTPVDLSGYTARMQLRTNVAATGEPLLELSTENGGITLGGIAGTVDIVAAAEQTAAMTVLSGVYDLELVSDQGIVTRLLQGRFKVSREVTR